VNHDDRGCFELVALFPRVRAEAWYAAVGR